ncbi:MAG: V-type ATP synthase subunit E [Bacteroidia bacterium]|nr:MAG: V-type ATP synthase subunit E [Bacteroidia bacterium]
MQKKLQELTEKIYQEGVDKARKEAEQIVSEAEKKAEEMIEKAEKEAKSTIEKAQKEADDLKKNALNELQLSARQAISDLKQEVVHLIQAKTIEPAAKSAFTEPAFTQDVIRTIVKNWDPKGSDNVDLQVLLPANKQKEFESYFKNKAADLLNKGLDITFSDKIKGGFKIGPKDGSYLVSFSDEDFEHFFKIYMRPRLIELLFDKKQK